MADRIGVNRCPSEVTLVLCLMFVSSHSSTVTSPQAEPLRAEGGGIDLIEVLNGTFSTFSFNGTWISGELLCAPYRCHVPSIITSKILSSVVTGQDDSVNGSGEQVYLVENHDSLSKSTLKNKL